MTPRGLLLDIDGTLVERGADDGQRPVPGAADAVRRVRERVPVRYVTNTTSRTDGELAAALSGMGFPVAEGEVVTPALLARRVLVERGHARGVLVADESSRPAFSWFEEAPPGEARAVLLATEAHGRTIESLFPAVEALLSGATLYAAQANRVFRRGGRLVPDVGPLAAYLSYAAGTGFETLGKPSPLLFETVAHELGLAASDLVMVGDDAEFDVAGGLAAGVGAGVLVKTGKYREGDETRVQPRPTRVLDSAGDLEALLAGG